MCVCAFALSIKKRCLLMIHPGQERPFCDVTLSGRSAQLNEGLLRDPEQPLLAFPETMPLQSVEPGVTPRNRVGGLYLGCPNFFFRENFIENSLKFSGKIIMGNSFIFA